MQRWRSWSAQKLPGRAVSRKVKGFASSKAFAAIASIEVHRTACIVTHPPGGDDANAALVNPANERLQGTRFTPNECWTNLHGDPSTGRWDADLPVYPHQSIDGLVSEFGGEELRIALDAISGSDVRCPTGSALATPALGELRELYRVLIHCVPPFYPVPRAQQAKAKQEAQRTSVLWAAQLSATYHAAFDIARRDGLSTLAVPILGAGARGAPLAEALAVAAEATVSWGVARAYTDTGLTVRFGVQDSSTAHALADAISRAAADAALTHGADSVGFAPDGVQCEGRWA